MPELCRYLNQSFTDRIGRFLSGKMRSSIHLAEQLITGEDFFGNPATAVEVLRENLIPLPAKTVVTRATDPILTHLHQTTGMDLVNLDRIADTNPGLGISVFDFISNFVGLNGYIERDSQKFNRELNNVSKELFSENYDDLSMQQAREVRSTLNQRGVTKPRFKGDMASVKEANRKRFRREFGAVRFNNLETQVIDSLVGNIPFNVVMRRKEEATRIPARLRQKISDEIIAGYQKAYDGGLRGTSLKTKAKSIANKVRRSNGLPIVR